MEQDADGNDTHQHGSRCLILVLTRRDQESIVIGNNITITVVSIDRGRVRLAINAPKDVPVHRSEVYDAIRREMAEEAARPRCTNCKCDTTNGDLCIDCAELAAEIVF